MSHDPDEAERLSPAPPVEPGARRALRLATVDIGPLRRRRDFRMLGFRRYDARNATLVTADAGP